MHSLSLKIGYASSACLAAVIFVADLQLALGVAFGMCYSAVIWHAHRWRDARLINLTACLSIVLCAAGFFASPLGSEFWMVLLNRSLSIALIIGTAALCHRNRLSEALLRSQQLALKAGASDLKTSNDVLLQKNAELEQFTYMVSHDLQAPLRSISSYSELIREELGEQADEDVQRWLLYCQDTSDKMHLLVQELLTYAQLEQKPSVKTTVDMNEAVRQATQFLTLNISESGAVVTVDELPEVLANASQIASLVQNLIANSLKYCTAPKPLIQVTATRFNPQEWKFCVSDNGIGIPPEQQARIFEPFHRLHGNKTYPGSGVGLASCQKIVEIHGGKIWVESNGDDGCQFYFTLPAAA